MAEKRVVNRFAELLAAKARREDRRITIQDVVEETGLARGTVDNYTHNTVSRFDAPVIKALCDYLGCEPGDLIIMEGAESPEIETPLLVP